MGWSYSLEGQKWGSGTVGSTGGVVTWSFAALPGGFFTWAAATFSNFAVDVTAAFARWEQVANIDFVQVADAANVRVGGAAIDGRWNVVGEARYSYYGALRHG